MLLVGLTSLFRKNTGGVGTLTAITIERFHVCAGEIYYVTGKGEKINATVTIPCESLVNTTGLNLPIDIAYNWRNPSEVAYADLLDGCSGCTSIGHQTAWNLVIASIAVAALCVVVAVLGCTYKRPSPFRAAVAPVVESASA